MDSNARQGSHNVNGAELLIKCLEAEGVRQVWGYPGGAIMPLYDALLDSPIRHYLMRHEQAAGFAAQGYARSTGEVGVCLATSGPGATNLVTAIADAQMDSIPLVAITGQVPTSLIGTDGFQEADVLGLSLSICKHSFLIESVDEIPETIREAFSIAKEGRPGPVWIDFPKDISLMTTTGQPMEVEAYQEEGSDTAEGWEEELVRFRELLAGAQRPVIYAGGGIEKGDAIEEFRAFVSRFQIPVVHTLHGLGGLPGDDPLFLGMLGMHGNQAANHAVQNCDLLIALGARFDDRATGKLAEFAPKAAVIHVDIDPAELGKLRTPTLSFAGDLKVVLPRLAAAREGVLGGAEGGMSESAMEAVCVSKEVGAWREQCQRWKEEYRWRYDAPTEKIYAPEFLRRMSERASAKTVICCDVGQHQMWVAQHFGFQHPRQHLTSGGLGTMGFGLPAAIGVQCGSPDARVIAVSGDGSIMMNIQELATIVRYGLPIKICLFNNSALGMVRQWQELFFNNRESEVDLSDNPDFTKIAMAFGIPAQTVSLEREIDGAIDELLNRDGPFFLHVVTDRAMNVWPLVPPGANNSQMLEEAHR